MNNFKQRIPGGFDPSLEPETFDFNDQNELLKSPGVIKRMAAFNGFSHYSMSGSSLIAVYKDNWWVIGYIDDPSELDLPDFYKDDYPSLKAKRDEAIRKVEDEKVDV